MDVDFMLSDSLEALKTKVVQPKTIEEAAAAVDAMFATAFQNAGREYPFIHTRFNSVDEHQQ